VTWALTTTAKAARRKVTRAVMSFILTWLVCRLDVEIVRRGTKMMELKRVWWVQRARVTSVRSTKVRLTMFVLGRRKQRKKTKDEVQVKLKEDKTIRGVA
jgi:hypothetical protein